MIAPPQAFPHLLTQVYLDVVELSNVQKRERRRFLKKPSVLTLIQVDLKLSQESLHVLYIVQILTLQYIAQLIMNARELEVIIGVLI